MRFFNQIYLIPNMSLMLLSYIDIANLFSESEKDFNDNAVKGMQVYKTPEFLLGKKHTSLKTSGPFHV